MVRIIKDVFKLGQSKQQLFGSSCDDTFSAPEHMVIAANALLNEIYHLVEHLFIPNGIHVMICGHSVGAGIASILGIMMKQKWFSRCAHRQHHDGHFPVQVIAFGPPPCLSYNASIASQGYIMSIINNNDCIPRLSMPAMVVLHKLLQLLDNKLKKWTLSPKDWKMAKRYQSEVMRMNSRLILNGNELKQFWSTVGQQEIMAEQQQYRVPGQIIYLWNHTQDPTFVGVKSSDCHSPVVRNLLVDESMIYDHTLDAYRANLELWAEQTANTI